jgi:hypothetical protein
LPLPATACATKEDYARILERFQARAVANKKGAETRFDKVSTPLLFLKCF